MHNNLKSVKLQKKRFAAINATTKAMTTREVERASSEDTELQQLRKLHGTWVGCADKIYAAISGELCVIGQLVLRGSMIVIPHKLRRQALALSGGPVERYCRACHGSQLVAQPDPTRWTVARCSRGYTRTNSLNLYIPYLSR